MVPEDLQSQNRYSCCSFTRFSIPPRPQYTSSYSCWAAISVGSRFVTIKQRVLSFGKILRVNDYPPTARPAVPGSVGEVSVDPLGLVVLVVALTYFFQLLVETFRQSIISCQAKDIEHSILLTPAHELLPAKSAVSAKHNPHLRPAPADPLHQQLKIRKRFISRIQARGSELGRQQLIDVKHIQRQVTIAVVIAMKELSLLMPMQEIISGIHIQNDFIQWPAVAFHKRIHKELVDLFLRAVV